MLTIMLMIAGVGLFCYMIATSIVGCVPKRGRWIDVDGEEVFATITNTNKNADKFATLRARDENGRKYSAKLRPTEAKLWIKGDKIKITLTKDGKNYRMHFHEYFKENEARIREKALEKLGKKARLHSIGAKLTGYNEESLEALRASKADSQSIFAYETYMRYIDRYFAVAIMATILFVPFLLVEKLQNFQLLVPIIILVVMFLSVNSTAKVCAKIYSKATKSE